MTCRRTRCGFQCRHEQLFDGLVVEILVRLIDEQRCSPGIEQEKEHKKESPFLPGGQCFRRSLIEDKRVVRLKVFEAIYIVEQLLKGMPTPDESVGSRTRIVCLRRIDAEKRFNRLSKFDRRCCVAEVGTLQLGRQFRATFVRPRKMTRMPSGHHLPKAVGEADGFESCSEVQSKLRRDYIISQKEPSRLE